MKKEVMASYWKEKSWCNRDRRRSYSVTVTRSIDCSILPIAARRLMPLSQHPNEMGLPLTYSYLSFTLMPLSSFLTAHSQAVTVNASNISC